MNLGLHGTVLGQIRGGVAMRLYGYQLCTPVVKYVLLGQRIPVFAVVEKGLARATKK